MNGIEQVFIVNGIKVIKGLCTVDFWIDSEYFKSSEITHARMYELIDTADKVGTMVNTETTSRPFITLTHGGIKLTAFVKDKAVRAKNL